MCDSWNIVTTPQTPDQPCPHTQIELIIVSPVCVHSLQGLQYLHGSGLKAHCRLKSNNVVIDGRWVCKLADFGLRELLSGQDKDPNCSDHVTYSREYRVYN